MVNLKKTLEKAGIPVQRGVYNGRDKPPAYCTFLRMLSTKVINADDEGKESRELYRVTLFQKGDYEEQLNKIISVLRDEGIYINSIDAENYEQDTGYWMAPITIEILKEDEEMTLGLRDLYYAVMKEQDGVESYDKPKKMAEAMSADLSVNVAEGKLFADDALSEDVKKFTSGTIKLGIKDLIAAVVAELLGQKVDGNNVVWAGGDDEPPYVAIGFRTKKTGGRFKYIWLLKCKFKVPGEKYQTEGESITFNTPEIEGTILLNKDNRWKADIVAKETDAVAQTWFDAVQEYKQPEETEAGGETEENIPTA